MKHEENVRSPLINLLTGKFPERYSDNSDGLWDFLPVCHRPNPPPNWDGKIGKGTSWRPYHDDFPILRKTLRTYTSFIFKDAILKEGDPGHWFKWEGVSYPKPWPIRGHHQKTLVIFLDPVKKELLSGLYTSRVSKHGLGYRYGPRVSDDVDSYGNGFVYVNWMPISILGSLLTCGIKKIKNARRL